MLLLILLAVVGFGVVLPAMTQLGFELCDVNLTASTREYIAMDVIVALNNPTIAPLVLRSVKASVVTGVRERETIPFEDSIYTSVAYGALVACQATDLTLDASTPTAVFISCALSQYASARASLTAVVESFIDGSEAPPLSLRYQLNASYLAFPLNLGGVQLVNLSSTLAPPPAVVSPPPPPPPPPFVSPPPGLPPAPMAPPSPPPPSLCPAELRADGGFNPLSILAGGGIGLPGTLREALTLIRLCDLLMCQEGGEAGSGVSSVVIPNGGDPLLALAAPPSELPMAPDSEAVCGAEVASAAARNGLVSVRMTLSTYNPLSLGAWIGDVSLVMALAPTTPTWQGRANESITSTNILSCALAPQFNLRGRGTTLRPQDWTALALDCSFATSLADAVANYTAGDTITMSMIAGVSASAMGVGFNRQMGRPIQFSLARADVLAALNEASAKGDGTAYGPPRLPPGVASCGGFTAAERLAQQASAQVLGVVTSLRFAWGEAGLPNDR